jgi:hypothetical protein
MTEEYHPPSTDPAAAGRILLLFVDGVGLAPAGVDNPLSSRATPHLDRLVGGPLTSEQLRREPSRVLVALDAGLGVGGLPQSATGQTALFTGVNAPAELGFHVTAYPGPRLKAIIEEHSLFRRAVEGGVAATFANAYTPRYRRRLARGDRRPSVTTCAVLAAGLPLRGLPELKEGRAVTWDIRRDLFARAASVELEAVAPEEAGAHLAAVAAEYRLTVFETFLTDLAGHQRFGLTAAEALGRLDGFLGGLIEALGDDVTLLLTSDHGNLEAGGHRRHTQNPVPLLACGPRAEAFAELTALTEVTPRILEVLGVPPSS